MATGRRPGSCHGPVSHAGTQSYPAGVWKTGARRSFGTAAHPVDTSPQAGLAWGKPGVLRTA